MQLLYIGFIVLHVILCLFLIMLILVQNDKGGGLAGAFGGMGGGAAFTGSSAATFLTKATGWLAVLSFVVLIGLNYFAMKGKEGAMQESELKGARKGLSSVLPGGGAPSAAPGGIPGLGAPSEQGEGAPSGQESVPTGTQGQ